MTRARGKGGLNKSWGGVGNVYGCLFIVYKEGRRCIYSTSKKYGLELTCLHTTRGNLGLKGAVERRENTCRGVREMERQSVSASTKSQESVRPRRRPHNLPNAVCNKNEHTTATGPAARDCG